MASEASTDMKTGARLIGHQMAFHGDNDQAVLDSECVIEIVDKKPEIEIAWQDGKVRRYLCFRQVDFERALKEF
jgi:hypothetical protein